MYVVYIIEAHASDLWQMPSNVRENILIPTTHDAGKRSEVAGTCAINLGIRFPALVDDMRNSTESAYTGWPDRLYVIDREGRIAFKTKPGPFGFDPKGVEETLARLAPGEAGFLGRGPV